MHGFKGDGKICLADRRLSCDIVSNCSPYAVCGLSEITNQYDCSCLPDFEGNGYVCEPVSTERITETEAPEEEPIDRVVEKCFLAVCWCPQGYEKEKGTIYCYKAGENIATTTTEESNMDGKF